MMELPVKRTLDCVAEVEVAAEDVLATRRQLIDLDAQRQKTRQAVRWVDTDDYQSNLYFDYSFTTKIFDCSELSLQRGSIV